MKDEDVESYRSLLNILSVKNIDNQSFDYSSLKRVDTADWIKQLKINKWQKKLKIS